MNRYSDKEKRKIRRKLHEDKDLKRKPKPQTTHYDDWSYTKYLEDEGYI